MQLVPGWHVFNNYWSDSGINLQPLPSRHILGDPSKFVSTSMFRVCSWQILESGKYLVLRSAANHTATCDRISPCGNTSPISTLNVRIHEYSDSRSTDTWTGA